MPKIPLSKGPMPPLKATKDHWQVFDMPFMVASAAQVARESMRASEITITCGLCYAVRGGVIYVSEDLTGSHTGP